MLKIYCKYMVAGNIFLIIAENKVQIMPLHTHLLANKSMVRKYLFAAI